MHSNCKRTWREVYCMFVSTWWSLLTVFWNEVISFNSLVLIFIHTSSFPFKLPQRVHWFPLCSHRDVNVVISGVTMFKQFLRFHSFRIALQQSSLSGRLVLYHFVGSSSSSSANSILMIRRFTLQVKCGEVHDHLIFCGIPK